MGSRRTVTVVFTTTALVAAAAIVMVGRVARRLLQAIDLNPP